MNLRNTIAFGAAAASSLALAFCGTAALAQPAPSAPPISKTPAAVLFWTQAQKEAGFQSMETRFNVHVVKHGETVKPLPAGAPLAVAVVRDGKTQPLEDFMAAQKTAGLLVIQDGRIRLERYALGYGPDKRWTSFSVAK